MDLNNALYYLLKEKETILKDIATKQIRLDEITKTEKTLKDLMINITVNCGKCCGTGTYFHRSCAEDEGDDVCCEKCKGTGRLRLKD